MALKPKLPKTPSTPKSAAVATPKMGFSARSLIRVFKPLLVLPILAIIALLVYLFVPQVVKLGRFTLELNFYCLVLLAVIAGLVILFVLVRLGGYITQLVRMKKQERLLGRAEILRLQERFAARWRQAEALMKASDVGAYEMPWYLVLGDAGSNAQALLEGAGLTFPLLDETQAVLSKSDGIDRWVFANEAIFIDTTGRPVTTASSETANAEWEAFLTLLAMRRPRGPVNGILLLLSAGELLDDPADVTQEKARQILARLQQIQSRLKVRVPLYLMVTHMGNVLGFSEFFSQLEEDQAGQILGWSQPDQPGSVFSPADFQPAFDDLIAGIRRQQFLQEGTYASAATANRAFLFPDEFAALGAPLADMIEILFAENRFAEPALFRGVYFTADDASGPLRASHSRKFLPDKVLDALSQQVALESQPRSLFIKDLFIKKIFIEPGLVALPRTIASKNLKIKTAGAVLAGLLILVGAIHLFSVSKRSARELQAFENTIRDARAALEVRKTGPEMIRLCERLASDRQRLARKGLLARALGLGKFDALDSNLAVIHRSVFQEAVLQDVVHRVENALGDWRGDPSRGEANFHLFAAALQEYIRWGNSAFALRSRTELLPFMEFLQVPLKTRYAYAAQFDIFRKEGGRSRRMTSPAFEGIVGTAVNSARSYLRPPLPNLSDDGKNLTAAQWWLKLSLLLQQIEKDYTTLLALRIPDTITPEDEFYRRYQSFRFFLNRLYGGVDRTVTHMQAGSLRGVAWIDVDRFYDRLITVSHGMTTLQASLEKDRQDLGLDYRHRIVDPILQRMPIVLALEAYPNQNWLKDILVGQFGSEHESLAPDAGIGMMVVNLTAAMKSYSDEIQRYRSAFTSWQQGLPARIRQPLSTRPPLQTATFNRSAGLVDRRMQDLNALVAPNDQPASAGMAAAGTPAAASGEESKEDKRKRQILAFWNAERLAEVDGRWLAVQNRARQHADSIYLLEICNRIDLQQGIPSFQSWPEIKQVEVFRNGDGIAMAAKVDEFLIEWLEMVPQSIRDLASENADATHYPEMRDFERHLKEVLLFQQTYLPQLRVAASNFAKCVQAMDNDPTLAWKTLRDSPWTPSESEQIVSWYHLQNFSSFRQAYELERGAACRFVTGQLEQIETHVIAVFTRDLIGAYRSRVDRFVDKYRRREIGAKFPFRRDGTQMTGGELTAFFSDLDQLSERFELAQGPYRLTPDGQKKPIAPTARRIVDEMLPDRWRQFYEAAQKLEAFLYDDGAARSHKFSAAVVPGPVGSHFHWLRVRYGNGTFRDLNVYGKPVVEMMMVPNDGTVTLYGLDAAKDPQASAVITRGDHALLQMLALFGEPVGADRKQWQVDIDLPLSVSPPLTVKSTLKFTFEESLPALPEWTYDDEIGTPAAELD